MENKTHILLVDDENDIIAMYKIKLERAGFDVTTASDGEESIALAEKAHPDLILMDIKMPKMDGVTAQKRLHENPATKDFPLVFLSAFSDPATVEIYKKNEASEGVLGVIRKGISLNELVAEVQKYILQTKTAPAA